MTLDNGTELFRVRARAQRGDDPEPRPVLVTREHDGTVHTYEPLSSGGDRRGLMRLAYAVPTDRVGPSTAFSLRLPDGYWIELPEPTPGENRTEAADRQRSEDAEQEAEHRDSPEAGDGAARRIAELEHELSELRSSNDELGRRLAELTAEHEQAATATARAYEELASLRGSHSVVEEELRSARESVAHALSELELAHAERDAAQQATEAARVATLETTRRTRSEHARLTGRLRQLQARIELQRADATAAPPGSDARLRQLESERERLATHIRALAELVSSAGGADDGSGAAAVGGVVANGAADRLETIRLDAVREANEHAERELRQLRAGTPADRAGTLR